MENSRYRFLYALCFAANLCQTAKDTTMLKRKNDISALPDKDREHILYTIDGLIKSAKLQAL